MAKWHGHIPSDRVPILRESGLADDGESLSPEMRQARTEASFLQKVELIESWAATGLPEGQWCPLTPTDLRRWHEPTIHAGVRAWGSPNIVSAAGQYGDLRRRFDAAVTLLVARRQPKVLATGCKDYTLRVAAEARVAALAEQNAELIGRLRRLGNDVEVIKAARDAAQRRLLEYEESFGRICPMPTRLNER